MSCHVGRGRRPNLCNMQVPRAVTQASLELLGDTAAKGGISHPCCGQSLERTWRSFWRLGIAQCMAFRRTTADCKGISFRDREGTWPLPVFAQAGSHMQSAAHLIRAALTPRLPPVGRVGRGRGLAKNLMISASSYATEHFLRNQMDPSFCPFEITQNTRAWRSGLGRGLVKTA